METKLSNALILAKEKCICAIKEAGSGDNNSTTCRPSKFWNSMLPYFTWAFDLSVDNLKNLRMHTEFLTGRPAFTHAHKTYRFLETDTQKELEIPMIQQYRRYTQNLPDQLWCSEPRTTPLLDAIGVQYKGKLVNEDIVRYQSCISNLYRLGVYDYFNKQTERPIILEIGGGYGGLAHQVRQVFSNVNPVLIIVDWPEMLFWSATYFSVNNPEKRVAVLNSGDKNIISNICDYDAVFVPTYMFGDLYDLMHCDLLINMLSFQEMTGTQLKEYFEFAQKKCRGIVYSDNFRKHWLNTEQDKKNIAEYMQDYLNIFPSADAYDHSDEDKMQRINLRCKHIGLSPKWDYVVNPKEPTLLGDEYEVSIENGEVYVL